jgi:hypothetical protein
MYQTIGLSDFRAGFKYRPDNFSYEGLGALFDHLESMGDVEFDPIAICCDYCEDTVETIAENYGLELPADEDEDDHRIAVIRYLDAEGVFIHETEDGKILYRNF